MGHGARLFLRVSYYTTEIKKEDKKRRATTATVSLIETLASMTFHVRQLNSTLHPEIKWKLGLVGTTYWKLQ